MAFFNYNMPNLFLKGNVSSSIWKMTKYFEVKEIDANHFKQCVVHFPPPALVYLLYRT